MNIFKWFKRKKSTCVDFGEGLKLTELPVVTFSQGKTNLTFLLDTGSVDNIINKKNLKKLSYSEIDDSKEVFGLDGITHECPIVNFTITYKETNYNTNFQVCDMQKAFDELKKETGVRLVGILGTQFFRDNKSILNFEEMKAYFK